MNDYSHIHVGDGFVMNSVKMKTEHKIYLAHSEVEFEQPNEDELHIILKHGKDTTMNTGNVNIRLVVNKNLMKTIVEKILE